MIAGFVRWLVCVGVLLALPGLGWAQEAVLSGTVSDSTGGVLPGVTVTAVHVDTGNTFVSVTDERGDFRLPVRVGGYSLLRLPRVRPQPEPRRLEYRVSALQRHARQPGHDEAGRAAP
jgi:hypothetical protein